jgi:hypothetical protein
MAWFVDDYEYFQISLSDLEILFNPFSTSLYPKINIVNFRTPDSILKNQGVTGIVS